MKSFKDYFAKLFTRSIFLVVTFLDLLPPEHFHVWSLNDSWCVPVPYLKLSNVHWLHIRYSNDRELISECSSISACLNFNPAIKILFNINIKYLSYIDSTLCLQNLENKRISLLFIYRNNQHSTIAVSGHWTMTFVFTCCVISPNNFGLVTQMKHWGQQCFRDLSLSNSKNTI